MDLDIGVLNSFGDDPVALDGFMSVSADGLTEHRWANDTGRYVIYSDYQKRFLVLDDVVYNSMMVRMLLADPSDFEEDFELVVDNYPLVRVYRVR